MTKCGKMKKIISAIVIFLVIISFFGFKSQTKKNDELVFWTLQLGTFDKYINGIIDEFEKDNPNVKIKWVDVPYSEGEKRTLAALLTDNPPDLINLTPDFSAMAAQKNALFEIPKECMTQYPQAMYPSLSYDGKFFAIPFYLTSAITFVNSDLAKKSGITKYPKTYEEMFLLAENVKNSTGYFVEMPTVNENDTFLKILNKYGITPDNGIDSEQAYSIFERYRNLYQNNLIPKESLTQSHREALEKYMSGQIVFLQAGANFLNIVKENAPTIYKNTDLIPQIVGNTGKYDFSLMNLIIPSKAKHKDDALKFALFLTNKNNQLELAKLTSVLPVNNEALADNYFKKSSTKEELARKISAEQIQNIGEGVKNSRNKKNIILLTNTALAEIMSGKKETSQTLTELNKKINEFKE